MRKWEISMMVAVAATILCCAAAPRLAACWWTTAFSPLCGDILGNPAGGEVALRSKLWEIAVEYLF